MSLTQSIGHVDKIDDGSGHGRYVDAPNDGTAHVSYESYRVADTYMGDRDCMTAPR